ncbi:T6SS immunity protein Tdi1 domain-containing protein [Clostridium paraputrificum]|uniref:T6SS immunity protein Tdi1 domain-containing protein n=1 Tax=Clostridium TaxID=1485 RepID=UPI003D346775
MEDGFEYFLDDIMDAEYVRDFLENLQYQEARINNGKLNFDECFGYVPLLGLGGSEKVENLQKVKIKEHIELITQIVGKIE